MGLVFSLFEGEFTAEKHWILQRKGGKPRYLKAHWEKNNKIKNENFLGENSWTGV